MRLNASLRDIISFYEAAGIQSRSVALLREFVAKNQTTEFLELAESYGNCNAFINHDHLLAMLSASWNLLYDGHNVEKILKIKRINNLTEDKKADPEVKVKQQIMLEEITTKQAQGVSPPCNLVRIMTTIPVGAFLDPNFDPIAHYNARRKSDVNWGKVRK